MNIGVYAIERDESGYSRYSNYDATVLGLVGVASKGPIDKPILCTSYRQFVSTFGPLKVGYHGLYAAKYFFDQGSKLYYVRACSTGADIAEAEATIKGATSQSATVNEALTVRFNDAGSYYNGYTLKVTKTEVEESDDTYTLKVISPTGATLEEIKDKTLNELVHKTGEQYDINATLEYIYILHHGATATTLTEGDYTFSGGGDGASPSDSQVATELEKFESDTIDIGLLAAPGYTSSTVVSKMLEIAEERGDCLCIIDPPQDQTIAQVKAHQLTLPSSSYGALYYDWLSIRDNTNQVDVIVPPSVIVPAVIARSSKMSEVWYAPAGLNRGVFTGATLTHKLTKKELNELYNTDYNINPIYEDPAYGPVIWGQKTLQKSPSVLDRINVRRLVNYLKTRVVQATNDLTFEPNDRITWNSFLMKVTPILDAVKNGRGLYDYRIVAGESSVTDEDIDNYTMPATILIKPTKAAEIIPIYFVITNQGTSFDELLSDDGTIQNI